jgi:Tol biopolymer transport system component
LTVTGEPITVAEDVDHDWIAGTLPIASAPDGTLLYLNNQHRYSRLTWFDRQGRRTGSIGDAAVYYDPALSPDGRSLVVEKADPNIYAGDLWVVDLARGTFTRATHEPTFDNVGVWSPDGRQIVFSSDRSGLSDLYVMRTGDPSPATKLFDLPKSLSYATDWSRDGRYMLVKMFNDKRSSDLCFPSFNRRTPKDSADSRPTAAGSRTCPRSREARRCTCARGPMERSRGSCPRPEAWSHSGGATGRNCIT